MAPCIGENICYYNYKSGDRFKVEVLDIQKKPHEKTPGEEYSLRIISIIEKNSENHFSPGLEMTVWKPEDASADCDWGFFNRFD